MKIIRIGAGAGYSGDRIEPAIEMASKGNIDYLIFECLAERTIAIAQQAKMRNPKDGYDPLLVTRMEAILPFCRKKKIKILTNMGAANPIAGAEKVKETARKLGIRGLKIAAVTGDDVMDIIMKRDYLIEETGERSSTLKERIISANAYLGVQCMVEALKNDADVVITGRVADPAIFAAPAVHEFAWNMNNWNLMGQAILMGHLLECAGQVTGGYFSDPGYKDVPKLGFLGFPIAEVQEDGTFVITKVPSSGGMITLATCKEQLLYEVHDPSWYITPDVVADYTEVQMTQISKDRVKVRGGKGSPKTDTLKVSIGYLDGFIGEGQISYGGPGAIARAKLALDIVKERIKLIGIQYEDLRCDLIGINSLHGDKLSVGYDPYEVRVRVAGCTKNIQEAVRIANEVETLYTNGPAGGAGAWKAVREVVAIASVLIPRSLVNYSVQYEVIQ